MADSTQMPPTDGAPVQVRREFDPRTPGRLDVGARHTRLLSHHARQLNYSTAIPFIASEFNTLLDAGIKVGLGQISIATGSLIGGDLGLELSRGAGVCLPPLFPELPLLKWLGSS